MVADAVAQAVQQERNEGQVRLANAVGAVKDCPKCEGYRENAKVVIDQQAEEIARLNREIKNLLYGGRGHG